MTYYGYGSFRASAALRNQAYRTDAIKKVLLFRTFFHYNFRCSSTLANIALAAAPTTGGLVRNYTTLEENLTSKEAFSEVCFRANKLTSLVAPFVAEYRKNLAAYNDCNTNQVSPYSSRNNCTVAEQAADSLLAITSSPKFLNAVSELYPHQPHPGISQDGEAEPRKSLTSERLRLHESFLKVTLWCLLAASTPSGTPSYAANAQSQNISSRLVQKAMDLAIRGEKLGLPPHLPLYSQLVVACGTHLSASAVLNVAKSIQRMLFPSCLRQNQPHFFDDCIRTMVYLGKYDQVNALVRGLHEFHELNIGFHLAFEITQQIKHHRMSGMYDQEEMEDLLKLLKRFVKNKATQQNYLQLKGDLTASLLDIGLSETQVTNISALLDDIHHVVGPEFLEENTYFEEEEDGADDTSSVLTVIPPDALESGALWEDENDVDVSPTSKDTITNAMTRPLHDKLINAIPPETSPDASFPTQYSAPSRIHEPYNKIVYIRDSLWIIPDIVESILATTGEEELIYSREFEDEIFRQLDEDMASDDEFDDDDGLFEVDHDDDDDDDDDEY
jgi:hypothetical protein